MRLRDSSVASGLLAKAPLSSGEANRAARRCGGLRELGAYGDCGGEVVFTSNDS